MTSYIDQGVTLRIQPGTVVNIQAAELDPPHFANFTRSGGNEAAAKMIWVNGQIIAEGTPQDSIIFNREPDVEGYYWGVIYLRSTDVPLHRFKHCRIGNTFQIFTGSILDGSLTIARGSLHAQDCFFYDALKAIDIRIETESVLIQNNTFRKNVTFPFEGATYYVFFGPGLWGNSRALVADNTFYGAGGIFTFESFPLAVVNNRFYECRSGSFMAGADDLYYPVYIYKNHFVNVENLTRYTVEWVIAFGNSYEVLYIHQNQFVSHEIGGINAEFVTADIADNILDGSRIETGYNSSSAVYNNVIQHVSDVAIQSNGVVYNNIIRDNYVGFNSSSTQLFSNNILANNTHAFTRNRSVLYENSIIVGNQGLAELPPDQGRTSIFRNCILDFDLPNRWWEDGGGNIWEDPMFVDPENGDFYLQPNSPAVDAGFDTLASYYSTFDLDYRERIYNGVIDIGVYEYNSTALGVLRGQVLSYQNGEPVDYVLLKINNQNNWFEFSDSVGYFEFKVPTGTYELYGERVFYEDANPLTFSVINGDTTEVIYYMNPVVSVESEEFAQYSLLFPMHYSLSNYPNPFNAMTTIHYELPQDSKISLKIYDVSGKLIKTLIEGENETGIYTILWNGKDEQNQEVTSGLYLYHLESDLFSETKQMVLLR